MTICRQSPRHFIRRLLCGLLPTLPLLVGHTSLHAATFQETGGLVVMEAEHASSRTAALSIDWIDVNSAPASGSTAIQALPDLGTYTDNTTGPGATYKVNFTTTGTYYLWVRVTGPSNSADSVHGGFNGNLLTSGGGFASSANNTFLWDNSVAGARITLSPSSAGVHTVHLWMREDGALVDKLLLTMDAGFTPSGTTDTESAIIVAPTAITSALSATGLVNTSFSYQITADNTPTGYSATGLPAGLSLNASTGLISGTPTVAGSSSIALSAANLDGAANATLVLSINSAPVITTQPVTQNVAAGATVVLAAAVSGFPAPACQWKIDGVNLSDGGNVSGATSATLTLTDIQSADAGTYTLVASNAAGTATSNPATLNVAGPTQRLVVNETFADGTRATQSVLTPLDSLDWFCSGASTHLTCTGNAMTIDESGRHAVAFFPAQELGAGAALTLSFEFSVVGPQDLADGLRFGLFDSNGDTSLKADNSNPSTITYPGYAAFTNLVPPAANPASFRKRNPSPAAKLITGTGAYSLVGSAGGPQQPFVAGTTYTAKLTILRDASGDGGTISVTYSGDNLSGYTLTRTDPALVATFDTIGITLYSTTAADSITIDNLALIYTGVPPSITTQPATQTVAAGTNVTLSVVATGTPAPAYQWQKNGVAIAGATGASLVLNNVQTASAAGYTAAVTNFAGTVTSNAAILTVTTTPPLTESFADGNLTAQTLPTSATWYGNATGTLGVTGTVPDCSMVVTPGGTGLAYWTATGAPRVLALGDTVQADFTLEFSGSGFPATADFFRVALLNSHGTDTNHNATAAASAQRVTGFYDSSTAIFQNYAGYMATAPLAPASPVALKLYSRNFLTTTGLTDTVFAYKPTGSTGGAGPYGFVPGNTYAATLIVQRTSVKSIAVTLSFTGTFTSGGTGTWTHTQTDYSANTYTFDTLAFNCGTDTGVTSMTVDDIGIAQFSAPGFPAITTLPASQTVNPGANVTFSVVAPGTPAPSFQWQKDGAPIPGATLASLTLTNVQPADEASYTVVVSNSVGTVASTAAKLTLNRPPAFVTQPASQAAYAGDTVTFSAPGVTGTRALLYQWFKNGAPIAGAVYPSLTLYDIQASDAGSYSINVANMVTTATSNVATLTVTAGLPPAVINSPTSAPAGVGTIFTYQITTTAPHSPTSYGATGLPAGLLLDPYTGIIEGRPTGVGTFPVTLSATNAGGTGMATLTITVAAAPTPVTTIADFNAALAAAVPGSVIVLKNGTYADAGKIRFYNVGGTAAQPVTIRAETPGGVILTGRVQFAIGNPSDETFANYTTLDGFRFINGRCEPFGDGFTSAGAIYIYGQNCRATECSIIDFNVGVNQSINVRWVTIEGSHIRIDHCLFSGKRGVGTIITVGRKLALPDYHRIDRNAFLDFQPGNSIATNGFEAIRLGDSSNSLSDSYSTVEGNFFEHIDADAEIISNKCGRNTYAFNTFVNCTGQLSLRIGPGCTVESNYIRQSGTQQYEGGIRVSDRDHIVRYNYVENVVSTSPFVAGIGLFKNDAGTLGSTSYWPVDNVFVQHNSLVNCSPGFIHGGGSGTIPPGTVVFAANVGRNGLAGTANAPVVRVIAPITTPTYVGEIYYGGSAGNTGLTLPLPSGVSDSDPGLTATVLADYTLYLRVAPASVGTDTDHIYPLLATDVGPNY